MGKCIQTCKRISLIINYNKISSKLIIMNAQGRKEIAKYIASLEEIKDKLDSMIKFDNMPEGLQESERGEAMQEAIEQLETACDNLDEVISALQEI